MSYSIDCFYFRCMEFLGFEGRVGQSLALKRASYQAVLTKLVGNPIVRTSHSIVETVRCCS
jgi:hypothetical protein